MKHMKVVGLMVVMLAAARLSGAQVLNEDVGVPLSSSGNPGGDIVLIGDQAHEDQVSLIVSVDTIYNLNGVYPVTTTFPGDLILTNGGNAPSDWLADIRFFNPLDPTGALDLPATETEAFFPADLGSGGFGTFQLMPNYNMVPGGSSVGSTEVIGGQIVYGPVGDIFAGQEGILIFSAYSGAPAASTPEPGALALLFGMGIVGVGLLVRRQRWFSHA